jgi:hypothetical protein
METLLWGIDLLAVVYLCYWALKQDGGTAQKKKEGK